MNKIKNMIQAVIHLCFCSGDLHCDNRKGFIYCNHCGLKFYMPKDRPV